ncbi:LysR family transcriptional regulator [Saccharopolyspora oryzae]|uniref:LysR family transcriptional regulator n=1 Tax=Saccharopolyspora oryzae TaxID=2997343 RepID=A0ABT4UUB1_9PSEU|nr:LysR family transcriptional regulator [Saccharopolyspora oryzae]MDA3625311.1 LysR family transcriptional regulator [Saccharopolyspora oryzae]
MNLQQLHYLIAVVDHGTMTAAARALHVSQPALGRAVRALEREVGTPLLASNGRRLHPTQEGLAVVAHARAISGHITDILSLGERRELVLAATPTLGAGTAPRLLRVLTEQCPNATVSLERRDGPAEVAAVVRNGQAMAGIVELSASDPVDDGLGSVALGSREIVLLCPSGMPVPAELPHAGLAELSLILPANGHRRSQLDLWFTSLGLRPRVVCETDERLAWEQMVGAGLGCAFTDRWHAESAPVRGTRIVRLAPPIHTEVKLLYRKDNPSRTLRLLLDALARTP